MSRRGRLIRSLILAGLLVIAFAIGLGLALWPPTPLEVPPQGIVLADVTVLDPGSEPRAHQTIRATATIASISDSTSLPDSSSASIYAGSYVLPGLIDLHVHHPIGRLTTDVYLFGLLHLLHGVTTVRDCGSIDGSVLKTRARVAAGEFAGPRIFACGPLIDGSPPAWPGAESAEDGAEGARIATEAAAAGVDCIKAYSNLSAEALRGIRVAATRNRLTLVGHVPTAVPFEEAHLDDVQHLTGVPGAAVPEEGGLIAAMLAGWDEISDDRIDFVARTSIEQGIEHTPTMVALERILQLQDYPALLEDPAARMLPRHYREFLWKPGEMAGWTVPPLDPTTRAEITANICKVIRRFHQAGVVLHVGSDSFNPFVVPGVGMLEELRNFAECGFTAEQVWRAATRGNGEALSLRGLGVLQPGAPADMLVFRKDPTRDLSALSSLQAIVTDGRLYPRDVLEDAVQRYRDYHDSWLVDRLTAWLFALLASPDAERSPSSKDQAS